ncbi:MAG: hypothetical protein J6S94_01495 [Bacteroidaceae bacterium]|nr:hypothetical protein [Bacteroidaceae bacterium]
MNCRTVGSIYGVGSVNAYFCFGVLGVILSYSFAEYNLTATDWLYGALELIALLDRPKIIRFNREKRWRKVYANSFFDNILGGECGYS